MNWLIQSYILLGGMEVEIHMVERLVYVIALGMTINDDIFLINFLRKIDYKKELLKLTYINKQTCHSSWSLVLIIIPGKN